MAMTPAERQQKRRARLKSEGAVRRDWKIDEDEKDMLSQLCHLRRPGKSPYTEGEVIGLLIRKSWADYQAQLEEARKTPCKKCGEIPPINSCPCAGDSECWTTNGHKLFAIKLW